MPRWLEKLLGALFPYVPAPMRPAFKRAFLWTLIRVQGLASGRGVRQGWRIEFLDFEIAYLEPFEYLRPGPGEIEVAAHFSAVSPGTERAVLCGLPGARRSFPYYPGYSCAGIVERAGARARGFRPGDRVAGRLKHASAGTAAAELLFRVPDGVGLEAASFIELGIITLQGMRKARIAPGDRVAVLGQGLIGQLANRIARASGAGEVIAVAPSRARAPVSMRPGGADRFLASRDPDFDPGAVLADVVIEAVGTPEAIVTAVRCARRGGRVVLLGSSRGLSRGIDLGALLQQGAIEMVGAHISDLPAVDDSPGRHSYRHEGELFLEMLRCGRLSVDELVTWRAAPDECNAVYEKLARGGGEHVAIILDWRRGRATREAA